MTNFDLESLDSTFLDVASAPPEGAVETAAPRKDPQFSNPADIVRRGLVSVVLSAYTTFRSLIGASLQNDKAAETLDTQNVGMALAYDLSIFNDLVAPSHLRERMAVKPGNGRNEPMTINFSEALTNIPRETIDLLFKYMPKSATAKNGEALLEFARLIDGFGVFPEIGTAVSANVANFEKYYGEPLNGAVDFRVRVEREVFNEDREADSIVFNFDIQIDAALYKDVIDSDEFSPYLVFFWVRNALTNSRSQSNRIVDPRKVSAQYNRVTKTHGKPRPKVNKNNFGLFGSGVPIFVPPDLDKVDSFIERADQCLNEDGYFSSTMLVEEKKLSNQIVYVDWINEVLAYTNNQGILDTIDLSNVHPLDAATEYDVLSTPVESPALDRSRGVIAAWLREVESEQAMKYAEDDAVKQMLERSTPASIFTVVLARSGTSGYPKVCYKHIAGFAPNELVDDAEEGTPERRTREEFATHVRAVRACIKALSSARVAARDDPSAFKLPEGQQSSLPNKLIGVEYLIFAMSRMNNDYIENLRKEWATERQKAKPDLSQRTFAIPNMHIGEGGLTGLLPHQGRIASSLIKSPKTNISAVQTGGGKTTISLLDALFGIVNDPTCRPMITTKGSLVKGTITEINAFSKGKLNAIPFRPAVIRWMKKSVGLDTFAKFKLWFNKLPPNTILVNSYDDYRSKRKLFDDLETVEGFAEKETFTTQYLMLIKLLGIRKFIGDESHMIKNPDSSRSRNSYSAFSQGDYRTAMSGTLLSNTVKDLVGQTRAISPLIFGDDADRFAKAYNIGVGIIKDDDQADVIKGRLKATTALFEANREDWSYMLPIKADQVVLASLTDRQTHFYEILMLEAQLLMEEAEKAKGKRKKPPKPDAEEEDDEDEEDDEEEDGDNGEEDADDAAVIAAAQTYLSKVEQFLVAPDENQQYIQFRGDPAGGVTYKDVPSGDDLVSPKVRLADKLIDEHLQKHSRDLANNKIIIFGWNKVASKHFLKHSKYASQSLHYVAGGAGQESLRRFKTNANNLILVGDEGSLREGENLQMTSLILRMQSVWSPGDHEQAVARMYRPDPRGKYNRESVRHLWVLAGLPNRRPSLDEVKMARLVSKFVSNARFTYSGRTEWRRVSKEFDDMEMLKMNLKLIFQAEREEIDPYLNSWATYVDWENDINVTAKRRLAEMLEAQTGKTLIDPRTGRILDINEFIREAMYKVTSAPDIPGTKRVWVPFSAGIIPADPKNWGFATMGQQDVPVGTVVYTEFGPGVIESKGKKSCKVRIYDGRKVGCKNNVVLLVNPDRYAEFAKIVQDPQKWREEALDINDPNTGKIQRVPKQDIVVPDDEVEDLTDDDLDFGEEDEEDEDERAEFDPIPSIINGWPAMLIMEDVPALGKIKGWNRVDPFLSISFRSWDLAARFLELVEEKAFIPDDTYNALQEEMQEMRSGKAMILGQQLDKQAFRNFFRDQKKKLGKTKDGKYIVKPYWIAVENEVKLAFDIDSHESQVISWLMKAQTKPGITKVKRNDAIWLNVFDSIRDAVNDLKALAGIGDFDERDVRNALREIKDEIMALKKPRKRPSL